MDEKTNMLMQPIVMYTEDIRNNNLTQLKRLINVKCNNAKESLLDAVTAYKEKHKDG